MSKTWHPSICHFHWNSGILIILWTKLVIKITSLQVFWPNIFWHSKVVSFFVHGLIIFEVGFLYSLEMREAFLIMLLMSFLWLFFLWMAWKVKNLLILKQISVLNWILCVDDCLGHGLYSLMIWYVCHFWFDRDFGMVLCRCKWRGLRLSVTRKGNIFWESYTLILMLDIIGLGCSFFNGWEPSWLSRHYQRAICSTRNLVSLVTSWRSCW